MKRQHFFIIASICVLTASVAVLGILHYNRMQVLLTRTEMASFIITANGQEHVVSIDSINEIGLRPFTATRRGGGLIAEVHFHGVLLKDICGFFGIDISGKSSAVASAADGFFSAVSIESILEPDNIWIAAMQDGEPLPSREDGGDGPFMLVVRNDTFSQNWCKYLLEVEFK